MSVKTLYDTLVEEDLLSMTLDEFQDSLQDDDYKSKVHETIVQQDLYSGDLNTFKKDYAPSVNWFNQTWLGRGIAAASTTGEATDLLLEGSDIDIATVQDFIKAKEQEARDHVPSERMQKFQEQYKKDGSSWAAFFKGVARDPALMAELFVQSLGTQIGTAIDTPESLAAAGAGLLFDSKLTCA